MATSSISCAEGKLPSPAKIFMAVVSGRESKKRDVPEVVDVRVVPRITVAVLVGDLMFLGLYGASRRRT